MEKAYDLDSFLEMLGGSREELEMMINMFIKLTPPLLSEMKEAVEQENWVAAGDLAHKIKSSLRLINAHKLVEEAQYIENSGRNGSLVELLPEKISQLSSSLLIIVEELKKEFNLPNV